MMILLKLISLTFIIVMGFKIIMSEGMLFENAGFYFKRKVDEGNKIFDLFICQWCMATLCSILAHGFAFGLNILPFSFNWQLLIRWPLVIMGASFLSGNIWNLYETVNSIKESNNAETEYYERCNSECENFFEEQSNNKN